MLQINCGHTKENKKIKKLLTKWKINVKMIYNKKTEE